MQPTGTESEGDYGDGRVNEAVDDENPPMQSNVAALLQHVLEAQEVCESIQANEVKATSYRVLPFVGSLFSSIRRVAEAWNHVRHESGDQRAPKNYRDANLELLTTLGEVRIRLIAAQEIDAYSNNIATGLHKAVLALVVSIPKYADALTKMVYADETIGAASRSRVINAARSLSEHSQSIGLALDAETFEVARVASEQTVHLRNVARQAAGEVGALTLGVHFENYAARERKVADRLRGSSLVVIALVTLVGAAVLVVDRAAVGNIESVEWVRLALVLPLIALAGYLGREASRHRRLANWAAQREVQLKTLEAYAAPMSETDRQHLRIDLGRRIFGVDQPDAYVRVDAPSISSDAGRLIGRVSPARQYADPEEGPQGSSRREERRQGPSDADS